MIKIAKQKNRKQKQEIYNEKYKSIPLDKIDRLNYMCDLYNINEKKMEEILLKRDNALNNLYFKELKVILYEEPEGTQRSRFRIINRKNFHIEAISNSSFVHVYSPHAKDDFLFMQKLTDSELIQLDYLINTPVYLNIDSYTKTPTVYNTVDTMLAEIGIIRPPMDKPDWDNIGKKYSDMNNHNLWLDDSSVMDGEVHKYYSILPRLEISIYYLNCVYNRHQYNKIIKRKDYDGGQLLYLDNKGDLML